MALDSTKTGTKIYNTIKSMMVPPGNVMTDDQLKSLWIAICDDIFSDIKSDAVVTSSGHGFLLELKVNGSVNVDTTTGTIE